MVKDPIFGATLPRAKARKVRTVEHKRILYYKDEPPMRIDIKTVIIDWTFASPATKNREPCQKASP